MSFADLFSRPIANLPSLHSDELLYSWCGRLHQINGSPGVRWTSQRLFDHSYAALAHDFPSLLTELRERTERLLPDNTDLVRSHTLLGYFLPWLDDRRADLALEHAKFGTLKDIKHHLGLPASRVGADHPLKACTTCMLEDLGNHGYGYWHIEHQYPTTWLCGKHQIPLSYFKSPRPIRHYREWLSPESLGDEQSQTPIISQQSIGILRKLDDFALRVRKQEVGYFQAAKLAKSYRSALLSSGLATDGGSIRMRSLIELIRDTYQPLRSIPGFRVIDSLTDEWAGFVGAVARPSAASSHPMKHLMLIALLFEEWDDFLFQYESPVEPKVLKTTLGPDIDPRHALFANLVINDGLSISAAGRHVGVSRTTAVRWAKLQNIYFTPRTKYLSQETLEKCRQVLRAGQPKAEAARKSGISMTSVTRLLSSEPELRSQWQQAIFQTKRKQHRDGFSHLVQQNPGVPLKLIRKLRNNGYAWLYRNDRSWLAATLAKARENQRARHPKPRPPIRVQQRAKHSEHKSAESKAT